MPSAISKPTEPVDIDGILVNIYDTAGIHDAINPVEIEGIRRAKELIKISDIQIRIVDGTEENCYESLKDVSNINQLTINLINKSDLLVRDDDRKLNFINISTKSNHNMTEFRKMLKNYMHDSILFFFIFRQKFYKYIFVIKKHCFHLTAKTR